MGKRGGGGTLTSNKVAVHAFTNTHIHNLALRVHFFSVFLLRNNDSLIYSIILYLYKSEACILHAIYIYRTVHLGGRYSDSRIS